jgi:hypothetical protein
LYLILKTNWVLISIFGFSWLENLLEEGAHGSATIILLQEMLGIGRGPVGGQPQQRPGGPQQQQPTPAANKYVQKLRLSFLIHNCLNQLLALV